ncbi:MAG: T9SS type A sorting domain-containing protein, partial [Desulfobacula sp.]|nr:T9SS type A sorting domain-containing protein [Desulfobacula sp.]
SVYPNPVTNLLFIENPERDEFQLTLISSSGKIIHETSLKQGILSLDVSQLNAGLYFVKCRDNNSGEYLVKKLIKKY